MLRSWARFLFFRAGADEMAAMQWRRFLGPALVATWLVGMGRYWDHPSAKLLQMFGVGSVVYVFVLGALLWAVIKPLGPAGWSYPQIVTFVGLTAPPAALYAIPVERWLPLDTAIAANTWFLAAVAAWRVALLVLILRRYARLTWPGTVVGCLLPLCGIVTALFALNLEQAVFQIMGGFRQTTANDGAYVVLFLLTLLSVYASVPLLIAYLLLVVQARRQASNSRAAAA
jgi:hypothetical protein